MSQPTPSLTLFGRPTHACPNLVKLTHHAGARTVEPCASPSSLRRRPASPGDEPARRPRVGAGTSVGHNANWRSVGVRERNVSSLCNIIARRWALPQGVPAPSPATTPALADLAQLPHAAKVHRGPDLELARDGRRALFLFYLVCRIACSQRVMRSAP